MNTTIEDRNRRRLYSKATVCIFVAFACSLVFAYAGTLTDIINSFLTLLITWMASGIVSLFDGLANFFINAMEKVTPAIFVEVFGSGFETFSQIIIDLGVGLAVTICVWQLIEVLFAPTLNNREISHPLNIALRMLVFLPLTFFIQKVALVGMGQLQVIWNAFNTVGQDIISASGDAAGAISVNTSAHFQQAIDAFAWGNVADSGIEGSISMDNNLLGVIGATIMIVLIMWNFMKLLLEACQRFVAMYVYCYLSPLAAACGTSTTTGRIFSGWVSLFLSSGVLWILNTWCISITVSLIGTMGAAATRADIGLFAWAIVTYGFVKVAQQLDDVFNQVGASVVRQTGGLFEDLVGIRQAGAMVAAFGSAAMNAVRGYRDLKSGIREGASFGQNPSSPVGSNANGQRIPNENQRTTRPAGYSAAGADAKKPITAAERAGNKAKEFAANSLMGSLAIGAYNSGKNFSGMMKERSEALNQKAENNRFVKALEAGDKATVNSMLAKNPALLKTNQVTRDTAAKALGLHPENGDALKDLRLAKDGRSLEATYQRVEPNGTVVTAKSKLEGHAGTGGTSFAKSADNRTVYDAASGGAVVAATGAEQPLHDVRALGNGGAEAHGYIPGKTDANGDPEKWGVAVQSVGPASDPEHAGKTVMHASFSNGAEATVYAGPNVTPEAVAESLVGGAALYGKQMQMGSVKAANTVSMEAVSPQSIPGAPKDAQGAMAFQQTLSGVPDAGGDVKTATVSGHVYDMGGDDGKHVYRTQYSNGSVRTDEVPVGMSMEDYVASVAGGRTVDTGGQAIPVSKGSVSTGTILSTDAGAIKTVSVVGKEALFERDADGGYRFQGETHVPEPGRAYAEAPSVSFTPATESGTRVMMGTGGNAALNFSAGGGEVDTHQCEMNLRQAMEMPDFYRDMQAGRAVSVKQVASAYGADLSTLERELNTGTVRATLDRDITNMSPSEQSAIIEAIRASGGDASALASHARLNRDNIAYLDSEQKAVYTSGGRAAADNFAQAAGTSSKPQESWLDREERFAPIKKRRRENKRVPFGAEKRERTSDDYE